MLIAAPSTGQVARMSLDELTSTATTVVHGHASQSRAVWSADRKRIYTEVTLTVDERLKGDGPGTTVVTIPGGQIGDIRYEVSDMPEIVEGEELVAFLWRHPSGLNLVAGGAQGKLSISRLTSAPEVWAGSELFSVSGVDAGKRTAANRRLPLDEFKNRIRKLVR
jgi:hypothetical protein